ncbi:MAG TPA: acyltransferase, partial [Candidatus Marinimicrobia bacterium]|nr:acyltransferase [Candidatus Neomarinimicrobiota bacterium]
MIRRYDVDWLRILALGLLIIYHISVVFQPWAYYIYFIQSAQPVESIWLAMGLINIWRIPLLFIISGMGVWFAMRRRNWKELLKDRAKRILLPLIFGSFFIVPISGYLYQEFNNLD